MSHDQIRETHKPPTQDSDLEKKPKIPFYGRLMIGMLIFMASLQAIMIVIYIWVISSNNAAYAELAGLGRQQLPISIGGFLLFGTLAYFLRKMYLRRSIKANQLIG